jgi:hypothetical protein
LKEGSHPNKTKLHQKILKTLTVQQIAMLHDVAERTVYSALEETD